MPNQENLVNVFEFVKSLSNFGKYFKELQSLGTSTSLQLCVSDDSDDAVDYELEDGDSVVSVSISSI